MARVQAIVFTEEGPIVAESLEELARALERARGRAYIVVVEGRVIGAAEARLGPQPLEARGGPRAGAPEAPGAPAGRGVVAAVFDQMFRGFADIVAREVPGVELHEVVGRGLEKPVRAGRVYKEPARDDFDVLSLVERLAREGKIVVFFTGDKKLANQAMALGDERIRVHYMPPNEYPGKESLAKAMIEAVRRALGETHRG
ncbi:MAG: hypothetical protein GSR80_001124 [Desulfurococcales archaeon]|nr:hypothetical protein [Desulfurococcales archaeon]